MPRCANCKEKFEQYEFNNKHCKAIDCQTAKALDKLDKIKKQQKKPRKSIAKVGKRTAELKAEYLLQREDFLKGKVCPVTNELATEIHHMEGREYERLLDQSEWLGVTRKGHQWIHMNPKEARQKGWLK